MGDVVAGLLTCTRCKQELPEDDFHRNAARKTGRRPECKECAKAYARDHHTRYAERRREQYVKRGRAEYLRRLYGIELEEFDRLLAEQGGRCAICQTPAPQADEKAFCVDHDHVTGAVRGILCRPCNSGIGHLRDEPAIIRAALAYLERKA